MVHLAAAPEFVRLIMIHELRRIGEGYRHTVVSGPGDGLDAIRNEGIAVRTVPLHRKPAPLADLAALFRLVRLLWDLQPDVLHTYTPKAGLVGQLAGLIARVPCRVHSVRGLLYSAGMSPSRRRLIGLTDRLTFWLAQRTTFVSQADMQYAVQTGLCPVQRARHTGGGIDLSLFRRPSDIEAARLAKRVEWGVPADAIVVLTVGRYVREKGYPELAAAVRRLVAADARLRFVWIAPVFTGEADVVHEQLLSDPSLAGVVIRIPAEQNMVGAYVGADVLAHPSHREGVPLVLIEAAWLGLPIVASDIPGNREVVRDGESARLFPVGDVDSIVTCIQAAIGEPTLTRRLAERAYLRAAECDVDRVSRAVIQVYGELVSATGATERAAGDDCLE